MLQKIREHIQGWIAGVIIALLAVAFIFWGIQYYLEAGSGTKAVVAKVNGVKITEQSLQTLVQQLSRRARAARPGVPLSSLQKKEIKRVALQQLVANAALLQGANDAGFQVSQAQLQGMLQAFPEFQENGHFSQERFYQLLYANSMTPQQFMDHLGASVVMGQAASGIQGSSFVSNNELKQAYELLNEQRSIGYFLLPSKRFESKVTVTQKQVEDYYKQNTANFKTPEKVQVAYLELSPALFAGQTAVSAETVKQYYDAHVANFTTPKRWKVSQIIIPVSPSAPKAQAGVAQQQAQRLYEQLQKGAKFNMLMQKYNASKLNITHWISQAQAVGGLATLLDGLKANEVTKPFRTPKGFAILKMLEVQQAKTKPFVSVQSEIHKLLQAQKTAKVVGEKGQQLSSLTYTNPTTLSAAAKQLGLQLKTSPFITRAGEQAGLFSKPQILSAVFSKEVLEQGNNSNVITLKDGTLVVLRVAKRQPSRELTFAEVAPKIKALLTQQMAQRQAGLVAYKIQSALSSGQSPSTLATRYNVVWVTKQNLIRQSKAVDTQLLTQAFTLKPTAGHKHFAVSTLFLDQGKHAGNYAIVELTGVKPASYALATTQKKAVLRNNLANFMGQLDYRLYAKSIMNNAKIDIKIKQ